MYFRNNFFNFLKKLFIFLRFSLICADTPDLAPPLGRADRQAIPGRREDGRLAAPHAEVEVLDEQRLGANELDLRKSLLSNFLNNSFCGRVCFQIFLIIIIHFANIF